MRVHIGSDHAGLELKDHLLGWLADHGHEPVDHGPFVYDALDDYPVFCLRAAEAVAADRADGRRQPRRRDRRLRQRRADRREQGARGPRRRWCGARRRAVLAREHNDANVVSVGGRMHSLEDDDALRRGLPRATPFSGDERHVRRIAMLADYERTGDLPPLPASALGASGRIGRCLRGTPSVGSPTTSTATLRRPARAGQQPAGHGSPTRPRCSTARVLVGADSAGKHLFLEFAGDRDRARPPRPDRQASTSAGVPRRLPVGPGAGCGWSASRPTAGPAYADLRGATSCALITPTSRRPVDRPARARPAAGRRRPGAGLARGSPAAPGPSATC